MCDQLRQDYLSCYGHQTLSTPNIDNLARRGVRFSNAYCQAPLCAPSRASFYSGRYQSSHGVMGNEDATQLGEKLLADYLNPLGYRTAVVGKTHNHKSDADLEQAHVDPTSDFARAASSGGFEPYEWHEGLYPDPILPGSQGYTAYLQSLGYKEFNPWDRLANSGMDKDGNIHSGWALRNSGFPAAIPEEHSETAFCTRRAMDFINESANQPWCLHLSYIKPHWPVIAPAPYHDMYGIQDIQKVVNSETERTNPHPVVAAFMQQEYSKCYADQAVRDIVIPVYMGLVKQIDDHLGKLFDFLKSKALLDNTMIVLTADHGDYLGDHFLGEKDLFHTPSVKIPLIVFDPRAEADATRNTVRSELVEGVDLTPTFVDFAGGEICRERIEGRSLSPILRSAAPPREWREYAVSEIDYSERGPRKLLNLDPYECRATMVADHEWKYVYYRGFPPQLFNLRDDPDELHDLGQDSNTQPIRQRLFDALFDWKYSLKTRVGMDHAYLQGQGPERDEEFGIIIGRW